MAKGDTRANVASSVQVNINAIISLREEMEEVKKSVNEYIKNVQNLIIKNKSENEMRFTKLTKAEEALKVEIENNKRAREELIESLSREMRNKESSLLKVNEMKIQQDKLIKERNDFNRQLHDLDVQINNKLNSINEQRDLLKNQTSLVNDKLYQFEQLLGLRIENSTTATSEDNEIDTIKFIFKNIDANDFSLEVSFVLDPVNISIIETSPVLEQSILDEGIRLFTESKEIVQLWKYMRTQLRNRHLE